MTNKTFIVVLVVAAVLLAGLVYMHMPRGESQSATVPAMLHGQ